MVAMIAQGAAVSVGAGFLNDMACAGQTAPGFPGALHGIAVEVCCDGSQ